MRAFLVAKLSSKALRGLNYSPAVERIRRSGSSAAHPLRALVKAFGSGYGTAFARLECSLEYGVELLSQSDVFAAEPQGRFIRRDSMPHPDRHFIERGQVLIAGVGTLKENEIYGRSLLADSRLAGKYLSQDAMALTFEEPNSDLSLYTYAWLASPTGVAVLRSTSYGTKLLRIRRDLLSTIPVPEAPAAVVARVARLVRKCVKGRETYYRAIRESRLLVEGNASVAEASEACSTRTRRSVVWDGPLPSICAWNFAAGGGAVRLLRDRWRTVLADVIESQGVFNGPRFARINCMPPHGIDFLSQRDVFMIRPVGRRIVQPAIPDQMLFVPKGALLVGSHGQMNEGSIFGKVELASFAGWRAGVTQDILRVLVKEGFREVAYAFLSTSVGQWLLKSTAVGTSIPSMRIDLLKSLPFPELGSVPTDRIKSLVLSAEAARIEADEAEAGAIRIIEEEVLPQWLA